VLKEQKAGGVISASAGNQALALAYHGHNLNIAVTVVMPHVTPLMKIELCRHFGASIIIHGNDFFEVSCHARLYCTNGIFTAASLNFRDTAKRRQT